LLLAFASGLFFAVGGSIGWCCWLVARRSVFAFFR
jgi:hypothetical protein